MQNSRNKIIALVLGVLLSFMAIEVSLRTVGVVYSYRMQGGNAVKKESGTFVVLCVGDSFTAGSGASEDGWYPTQLEKLLQKKYPERKIRVVNKGRGAYNTAMILKEFDDYGDTAHSGLIVILAGGANLWNAYGYRDYLGRSSWVNRLHDFFYSIKTFKLIKLFIYEIKKRSERFAWDPLCESTVSPKAMEWYSKGVDCENDGKYDEAIRCFKKTMEEEPSFYRSYDHLADMYFKIGNKEESRRIYRRLIKLNPTYYPAVSNFVARFIRPANMANIAEQSEDIQFIQEYARVDPVINDMLKLLMDHVKNQREIGAWVTHDVEEMIRRARGRGIKVILQDYPDYDNALKYLNAVLRDLARKNAVPFVDNEQVFKQLFLKGEHKDDYFAFDKAHCNERGYGVMAKNVYNCILENGFIETKTEKDTP